MVTRRGLQRRNPLDVNSRLKNALGIEEALLKAWEAQAATPKDDSVGG